ncbi:UNVERIFIED_CONTAM: Homeobox protein SHOOT MERISTEMLESS [Sesamum radiatum]|uniref:Homeobox protein SHOOT MERISTEMLESS n=1 Tax=Sesamum radiatum TaxID=300843 RepID=A0AAW2LPS9_SESRA
MEGTGVGSSSNSCLMAFGENNNNNGFCPIIMMPPMASSHPNPDAANTLFLPLPLPTTTHQNLNRDSADGGSSMMLEHHNHNNNNTSTGYYFMESSNDAAGSCSSAKAKIMAHPHYHRLLAAYANCQKIIIFLELMWTFETDRSPTEVVAKLEEACASAAAMGRHGTSSVGEDPALDQFMEAYCEMLAKYEQELSKPFKEAMLFLSRIECQFKALSLSSSGSGDNPSFLSLSLSSPPACIHSLFILEPMTFILLRSYCLKLDTA